MIEREWNKFMNLTMIGNKVVFEKWDLYVDLMHHALAIDDWGKNFGVVSCANWYFTDRFNLFVKGMIEQNKSEVDLNSAVALDHLLRAGHTYARYGLGFECRMTESYTEGGVDVVEDCWNFNIGATWTVDFMKLKVKN